MTREQIKKIVRLTEAIVNKRLTENRSSKISGDEFSALENALVDNPKTTKQYERFVTKIMKRNDNAELWDDVSLADYELTYKFMKDLAAKNGINESISRTLNRRLNESPNGKLREDGFDQYGEPIRRNSGGSLYTFYIKNPSVKAKINSHGRWQNVVDERNGKYVINSSHIDDFTDFIRDNGYDLGTDIIFEMKNNKRLNENGSYYRTEFSKISAAPGPTQPKIQIMDDHAKTKWIDLNNDSVPELIGWLQRTF